MTRKQRWAQTLIQITRDIPPVKRPYIPTTHSKFDDLRGMSTVELRDWFQRNRKFYDYVENGRREPLFLTMVSKLQYANLLLKGIIKH